MTRPSVPPPRPRKAIELTPVEAREAQRMTIAEHNEALRLWRLRMAQVFEKNREKR